MSVPLVAIRRRRPLPSFRVAIIIRALDLAVPVRSITTAVLVVQKAVLVPQLQPH